MPLYEPDWSCRCESDECWVCCQRAYKRGETGMRTPAETQWACLKCGEVVTVALAHNLNAMVADHKQSCKYVRLTDSDVKFLEQLKVRW